MSQLFLFCRETKNILSKPVFKAIYKTKIFAKRSLGFDLSNFISKWWDLKYIFRKYLVCHLTRPECEIIGLNNWNILSALFCQMTVFMAIYTYFSFFFMNNIGIIVFYKHLCCVSITCSWPFSLWNMFLSRPYFFVDCAGSA